jgi:hypothetical protein
VEEGVPVVDVPVDDDDEGRGNPVLAGSGRFGFFGGARNWCLTIGEDCIFEVVADFDSGAGVDGVSLENGDGLLVTLVEVSKSDTPPVAWAVKGVGGLRGTAAEVGGGKCGDGLT